MEIRGRRGRSAAGQQGRSVGRRQSRRASRQEGANRMGAEGAGCSTGCSDSCGRARAAPELSIMRAPAAPSLPPSLLPSPPRLRVAASRAGSPVRSALAQALLLTGRRTPTPRPGPVHLLLQLLQSHFQALSPQDPSGWGREGEGREKARNEARACALAVASLRPEVPCPAHLARRRHFPGLVFPEGCYPWSLCCGEFDQRCR